MFLGDASACTNANGDAHSPGQLAAPAPGREQTRHCISSYVSGAPKELLYAWQERSTPDGDAGQLGHSDIRTPLDIGTPKWQGW
jgi:hypothetical protein